MISSDDHEYPDNHHVPSYSNHDHPDNYHVHLIQIMNILITIMFHLI